MGGRPAVRAQDQRLPSAVECESGGFRQRGRRDSGRVASSPGQTGPQRRRRAPAPGRTLGFPRSSRSAQRTAMSKAWRSILKKIDPWRWELPKDYKPGMRVPGLIFAAERMLDIMAEDQAIEQG